MDSFKDIKAAFNKRFKDKTIMSVTDYDAENLYVIRAVPSNRVKEATQWLDGLYSMDKSSLKIVGAFNPLLHNPEAYFEIVPTKTYYPTKEEATNAK